MSSYGVKLRRGKIHHGTFRFIFGSFQLFYKNKIKLEILIKLRV